MNSDQIEGNWKQLKGSVREHWGKLTDNDLDVIGGKREQLAGALQKHYGYTKEVAEKEIEKFFAAHPGYASAGTQRQGQTSENTPRQGQGSEGSQRSDAAKTGSR